MANEVIRIHQPSLFESNFKMRIRVVLIYHSGKGGSKGLRGHINMNAAMDLTIDVKKTSAGHSWSTHNCVDFGVIGLALFQFHIHCAI